MYTVRKILKCSKININCMNNIGGKWTGFSWHSVLLESLLSISLALTKRKKTLLGRSPLSSLHVYALIGRLCLDN